MLREYAGGLVGNGCVGLVFSPGTSLCGTGALFDRPHRLSGHAIEHAEETLLARNRDALIGLPLTMMSARIAADDMS